MATFYYNTVVNFWFTIVVSSFHQRTPLHMATLRGDKNVVVYLVDKGAAINAEDMFQVCT